jgi:hypothetical protein
MTMSSPRLDYSHAVYGAIKVLAASLRDFAILAAREPLSRFTQCSMQNFAVQDGGVSLPSLSGVEHKRAALPVYLELGTFR